VVQPANRLRLTAANAIFRKFIIDTSFSFVLLEQPMPASSTSGQGIKFIPMTMMVQGYDGRPVLSLVWRSGLRQNIH
jgi:hypothetical protein